MHYFSALIVILLLCFVIVYATRKITVIDDGWLRRTKIGDALLQYIDAFLNGIRKDLEAIRKCKCSGPPNDRTRYEFASRLAKMTSKNFILTNKGRAYTENQ